VSKNKILTILLSILLVLVVLLSFEVNLVQAKETTKPEDGGSGGGNGGGNGGGECPPGAICISNPLKAETFEELVDAIVNFIFWIAIAIVPLMVLIGAFYFLTAAGDPKKIATGQRIILYTVIGFAIILFARGIIAVIKHVLGVK